MKRKTEFYGCKDCGSRWHTGLNVCPACGSDDIDEIVACPFCGADQYLHEVEPPVDYCSHDIGGK